jgi:multidrug transporter EmrE-like cation transporter
MCGACLFEPILERMDLPAPARLLGAPPLWLVAALLSIASASAGQILLKIGVRNAHLAPDVAKHPLVLLGVLFTPYIMAGIAAFGLSMLFWLGAISGQELSTVYPMAALGYVVVTVLSVRLFHDHVDIWKLAGIALIVAGVLTLNIGAEHAQPLGSRGDVSVR